MATMKVKIADFAKSARAYAQAQLKQANLDGNTTLSLAEAARLPADLQDNFVKHGKVKVSLKTFVDDFVKTITEGAKLADKNGDGYLTKTDGRRLPASVRDNFNSYVAAFRDPWAPASSVNDDTAAGTIDAHLAAWGTPAISYADAFARAVDAVLTEEEGETPRAIIRQIHGDQLSQDQLNAAVREAVKGLTLLPVGESDEEGTDPASAWIFSVRHQTGSDHGFWVAVDRNTGDATVSGFN